MRPIFQRTQEVFAIYRVLVPLPVVVAWKSGDQGLLTGPDSEPSLQLSGPSGFKSFMRFDSTAHAAHTAANGLKVKVPTVWSSFLDRLVREGRAAVVWGPHQELYWLDRSIVIKLPVVDAYYTFHRGRRVGDVGLGAQIPPPEFKRPLPSPSE